jgi:uncharacterized protein (DUF1778 family)
MPRKSEFLQVRLTRQQKAALRRLAKAAGTDVSSYVLGRALPAAQSAFAALMSALEDDGPERRHVLAELNDLLAASPPGELRAAVAHAEVERLTPLLQNYVAAMVEHAAHVKRVKPPAWTARVRPLEQPYFAASLRSLRPHLLRASPVAFKRRNLFVDATVGARV